MTYWPQYVILALALVGTIRHFVNDKTVLDVVGTCCAVGLVQWVLFMGGFYDGLLR